MVGIKMAYYKKKDWKRFLKLIDDRENMHETWEEWERAYKKTKKELSDLGFDVQDVVVNLNELTTYCKNQGIQNTVSARSQFVENK